MCMHWQRNAVNKFYEEHSLRSKEENLLTLEECKKGLQKAWDNAIAYHGSKEAVTHGFYSGAIYYEDLKLQAITALLNKQDPQTFPLPEDIIVIWRNNE